MAIQTGRLDTSSGRNFGWGRTLQYAGVRALATAFGGGHYGSVASHSDRWKRFATWAKAHGANDARKITLTLVDQYGRELAERVAAGQLAVSHAQNLLSTTNVILESLRGDRRIRVSPAALVGRRALVRRNAPAALDRSRVQAAAVALRAAGLAKQAASLELARDLGVRLKEAALLNARAALAQAHQTGRVNITRGTKGGRGRHIDRLVPVRAAATRSLAHARALQAERLNLVEGSLKQHLEAMHSDPVRAILRAHGLIDYKDARAAYACGRYRELTGQDAPAVAGKRLASRDADRDARVVISQELGHSRLSILSSYVGSSR